MNNGLGNKTIKRSLFCRFSDQKGFSLTEAILAISILGAFNYILAANLQTSKNSTDKTYAQLNLMLKQQNVLTVLKNDKAWEKTVNDGANTSLVCLKTGADCSGEGGAFRLRNVNDQIYVDGLNSTNGLNLSGTPCTGFGADPDCPLRMELTWDALCSEGVCIQAQIKLKVLLAENSNPLLGVNADSYSATFYRDIAPLSAGGGCGNPSIVDPTAIGTGTIADPYILCTPYQVNNISNTPALMNKVFKLGQDINMGVISGNHNPIGKNSFFEGTIDGDSHKIIGFRNISETANDIGFISRAKDAVIKNLILDSPTIRAYARVGGFIGFAETSSVTDSSLIGRGLIFGGYQVGGIAGYTRGITVDNVNSDAYVSTIDNLSQASNFGGLVGEQDPNPANGFLTIKNSAVTGEVHLSGDWGSAGILVNQIGGLFGSSGHAVIEDNRMEGFVKIEVTASSLDVSSVGGIAGHMEKGNFFRNEVDNTTVEALNLNLSSSGLQIKDIGGLIGTAFTQTTSGSIIDSHFTGNMLITTNASGTDIMSVGGLIGEFGKGSISTSTVTGNVSFNTDSSGLIYANIGGFLGLVSERFKGNSNNFTGDITLSTDTSSTEINNVGGFIGSFQMQDLTGFVGFFSFNSAVGNILLSGSASGVLANSFGGLIGQANFGPNNPDYLYRIMRSSSDMNITLRTTGSGSTFNHFGGFIGQTVGPDPVMGRYPIFIFHNHATGDIGMDVTSSGVDIFAVGGFIGQTAGTKITSSYSTGRVVASANGSGISSLAIGGFIGEVENDTSASNCYTTSEIVTVAEGSSFSSEVGGFIGRIESGPHSFSNSYASALIITDDVSAASTYASVGGFIGNKLGSPSFQLNKWDQQGTNLALLSIALGAPVGLDKIEPKSPNDMFKRDTYTSGPGGPIYWSMDTDPPTLPGALWNPPNEVDVLPTLRPPFGG